MSQSDRVPARPANPFARQVAAMRQVMLDCVTAEHLRAITLKLIELARDGNVSAAKLLLQYTLGKPPAAVEPDRLDIDEVNAFKAGAVRKEDLLPTILNSVPADVGAELLRELTPIMGDLACAEFQKLGALAKEREEEEAAVTKRGFPAQPATLSDRPDATPAEALRLVKPADGKREQADQRAANQRQR